MEAANAVVGTANDASADASAALLAANQASADVDVLEQTLADGPVVSVNGQTGVVALTAADVGAVVSVNGQTGTASLGIDDLTDVDTSSGGHVPTDGQVLTWNNGHSHWMPMNLPSSVPTGSWSGIAEAT